MSLWQLKLLGAARLYGPGGHHLIERKPAALLAYLALAGPTTRSRLGGLFWAEAREGVARVNLRQLLRRVRQLPAVKVGGDEVLRLTSPSDVDCVQMQLLLLKGERGMGLGFSGELLSSYDYADCPGFQEWLTAERELLDSLRRQALMAEIEHLQNKRAWAQARVYAERLITLDPLSEEVCRNVMRLYYLMGDRKAALALYQQVCNGLLHQFGLEPMAETVSLAREVAEGVEPLIRSVPELSHAILRPPLLIGREAIWRELDAAWEAHKIIFISGEAGVGKTRLMLDFAASKGPFTLVSGRPGDVSVPYATHARCMRQFLDADHSLLNDLEPWVVDEIARIVPDLGNPPPTSASEEAKLRHLEAHTLFMKRCLRDAMTNVCDDMQYYDAASFEAGTYAGTASPNSPFASGKIRSINAFRRGELTSAVEAGIAQVVASGTGVRFELGPLEEDAVRKLIEAIEPTVPSALTPALVRRTGGNPLFVLETLRGIRETSMLETTDLRSLKLPDHVLALITERLHRLSLDALRLAWVAAIAETDFDPELACDLLEIDHLVLAQPWSELERAQIFVNSWFSHDLLYEAVLGELPVPIRVRLHKRCAQFLEQRNAPPSRIARHYLEAGDEAMAMHFRTQAGVHQLFRRIARPN